jgi:hypothetical protein
MGREKTRCAYHEENICDSLCDVFYVCPRSVHLKNISKKKEYASWCDSQKKETIGTWDFSESISKLGNKEDEQPKTGIFRRIFGSVKTPAGTRYSRL